MTHQLVTASLWIIGISALAGGSVAAESEELAELKGNWQAVEMVDNGRVIPAEAIPSWLPSGGRIEIVDNSIVFTSPKDGQRYARIFAVDATTYPRQLNIFDGATLSGQGIYRIDNGRLVVCVTPPSGGSRPTEFSAREGSHSALVVFTRADVKTSPPTAQTPPMASGPNLTAPPVSPPAQPNAKPLTDGDIGALLPGVWKWNDAYGAFFLSLDKNGTYATYREEVATSSLQKVFTKLPLSSGTWRLTNGQVVLQSTSAVYADRLYKTFPFTIRSVSSTELQFVDYAGNVGTAVRSDK